MTLFIGGECVDSIQNIAGLVKKIKALREIVHDTSFEGEVDSADEEASNKKEVVSAENLFPPIQVEKILLTIPAEALVVNLFDCDIEYLGTAEGQTGLTVYIRTDQDAVLVQLIPGAGDFTESLRKIFSQLKSTQNIKVRIVGDGNAHVQQKYIREMLQALHELSAAHSIFIVAQYLSKNTPQQFAFSLDTNALVKIDSALVDRLDQAWCQAAVLASLMNSKECIYPIRAVGYAEQAEQSTKKALPENFLIACLSVLCGSKDISNEGMLSRTFDIIPGPTLDVLLQWLQSSEGQQVIRTDLCNKLSAALTRADRHYEKKEFTQASDSVETCFNYFADGYDVSGVFESYRQILCMEPNKSVVFDRVMAYLKTVSTHTDLILACICGYVKIARSYFCLDQSSEDFKYHAATEQAMQRAKKIAEQFLPRYLTEQNELSDLIKEQEALKVKKAVWRTGSALLNTGRTLHGEKNYERALNHFQEGATCFESYVDDPNYCYEAAKCYSNSASCLVHGKQPGALDYAGRALVSYAQTAAGYAKLYLENKDEVYATLAIEAAEKVFSTIKKFACLFTDQAAKKKTAAKQVGMLIADQGRALFPEKKYERALEAFTKALTYFDPHAETDTSFLYESARSYYNSAVCHDNIGQKAKGIAISCAKSGRPVEAKEKYQEKLTHHDEALTRLKTAQTRFKQYVAQMQAQTVRSDTEEACVILAKKMINECDKFLAGLNEETAALRKLAGYQYESEQKQADTVGTPTFAGPG